MTLRTAVRSALVLAATVFLCVAGARNAAAQPDRAPRRLMELSDAIESRAMKTSFADLERWGEQSLRATSGRERLNRIHHVAWILLNQSEFSRFERWNRRLATLAEQDGDARYAAIARIDALKRRQDEGDSSVDGEVARISRDEPDWFARAHALSVRATSLGGMGPTGEGATGEALKLIEQAQVIIPEHDRWSAAARANVFEGLGVVLMSINDLKGAVAAFAKSDFEFSDRAYPRPDYDSVYNMANLALTMGRGSEARALAAAHHRLSIRSDLKNLRVWDMRLCAAVADAFGAPAEVMDCLKPLDANLASAGFLAAKILPLRAIAEARLGQVAAAEADLKRLDALVLRQGPDPVRFARVPEVRAEILMTKGQTAQAFAAYRDYARRAAEWKARQNDAGVRQLTEQMMAQLGAERRNIELQADVIRSQKWIAGIAVLFLALAGAGLFRERKIARELKAARLKAEAANRTKSEFLANMSHEIRTPLNGVVGVADLLARSNLPPREHQMVELVRESGRSLERLLSDVLDLARVEAGRMEIESAPFEVGDLARSVAGLSRLKADEKGVEIRCEVSADAEGWVMGDATRVRQIVTNLVSNAVKFTEKGSVTVRVDAPASGRLRFEVEDTGIGFDAEEKGRLFARFQQADGSITRRFGGSGLGLAICRQLADLMDGRFDCESEPGRGSRFWFEAAFPATCAPAGARTDMAGCDGPGGRPLRVLLADDHPTNQTVVRMMLDPLGVETTTVGNGAEALEAMSRGRFDVVLMDMQMPVMDGLQATAEIRRRESLAGGPRTPVIMLSANALNEHLEASRKAGADRHVSKPVTIAELTTAISAVLDCAGDPDAAAEAA